MDIKEIIKILPPTEKILVNYSDHNHELKYIVTENIRTGDGYLYKIVKGKLKKIDTSDIPYFEEPENFLRKEIEKYGKTE